ncbi:serine/threonine protein kinase [Inediibacterium massiliense]|uniref:serine/threonine protein kinase n=1 Tax=Inediibacterium massiliense TaxID=1658111 RepID=UPI0006B50B04|nr:protein kinase [Inediibacterium massiliense]
MNKVRLSQGEYIIGKWNKNVYKILDILGEGGVGKVYKVKDQSTNQIWALKVSDDLQSITKEYDMLKKFFYMDAIPCIKEIDDFIFQNHRLYYIVMEYIQGKNLKEYIKTKKVSIKSTLGIILFIGNVFKNLHDQNFIFGDLKLENIMIDEKNHKIKIIDLGGVVCVGDSIKEFTPNYDRASWNMGIRRADEKYDLFSITILMIHLLTGTIFCPHETSIKKMIQKLKELKFSTQLIFCIQKCLNQTITFKIFLIEIEKHYKAERHKKNVFVFDVYKSIDIVFIGSFIFFILVLYKCCIK